MQEDIFKMYIKKVKNINWFATTIEGMENLYKCNYSKFKGENNLTSSDYRLLFYLLSKIDDNNMAEVEKYENIVKKDKIGLSIRKISEGFKKLIKAEIIIKVKTKYMDMIETTTDTGEIKNERNVIKTYFINPRYFYTGGKENLINKKKYFDDILGKKLSK